MRRIAALCVTMMFTCFLAAANPPPGGDQLLDPPLPPGAADNLLQRMRDRRAAALGQPAETEPSAQTQPAGPIGGSPRGANIGGAFGPPPGWDAPERAGFQPGPSRGLPGRGLVPQRPRDWAREGWSDEMDGLRGRLIGNWSITPNRGFSADPRLFYVQDTRLEFCLDDPGCWACEIRDSAGNVIMPKTLPAGDGPADDQHQALGTQPSSTGTWRSATAGEIPFNWAVHGLRSDQADPMLLRFADLQWRVSPGDYTLRLTLTGRPDTRERENQPAPWNGTFIFPPVDFTVYGPFNMQQVQDSAAVLRGRKWTDQGDLYRALAKLIPPDVSEDDVKAILPKGDGEETGFGVMSGGAGIEVSVYPLDERYVLEISGNTSRIKPGTTGFVLSRPPRVMTKQEYAREHTLAPRGGGN